MDGTRTQLLCQRCQQSVHPSRRFSLLNLPKFATAAMRQEIINIGASEQASPALADRQASDGELAERVTGLDSATTSSSFDVKFCENMISAMIDPIMQKTFCSSVQSDSCNFQAHFPALTDE